MKSKNFPMKTIDTRWVTVPVGALAALVLGEANPWVIALICIASLKIDINIFK